MCTEDKLWFRALATTTTELLVIANRGLNCRLYWMTFAIMFNQEKLLRKLGFKASRFSFQERGWNFRSDCLHCCWGSDLWLLNIPLEIATAVMCWKSKGRIRTKFISPLLEWKLGKKKKKCLDFFHFNQAFHHRNLSISLKRCDWLKSLMLEFVLGFLAENSNFWTMECWTFWWN